LHEFIQECGSLGISLVRKGIDNYFADEARFCGHASALARIREVRPLLDLVKAANKHCVKITIVSGKTSLTGAAVPLEGVVVDLKGLDFIDQDDPSVVGPGVILKDYKNYVHLKGLFYPPDPTSEESCTIGGNVACNASGALSYFYGPTRDYVSGLKVLLPTGAILDIDRGQVTSSHGLFRIPAALLTDNDSNPLNIPAPKRGSPPWRICKSSAGLYSSEPMDLVDLFIGSEGILGIFLQVRTRLLPRRDPYFALMLSMPSREVTCTLVKMLDSFKCCFHDNEPSARDRIEQAQQSMTDRGTLFWPERFGRVVPSCMEWFGGSVATLLPYERFRRLGSLYGALYVEQEYREGDDPLEIAGAWADLVKLFNVARNPAQPPIDTQVALDEEQIRRWRNDRKTIPEKLNESIRPGLVKVGMDYAVPMDHLEDLLKLYDDTLPPGKSFVFGHIGNAHLHANVLPENSKELESCRNLNRTLADRVCKMGGTVSGEHGIGKMKHDALRTMLGDEGIEEIRSIKRLLDPNSILNIGNMVD
jgi:D-lactate dehydrogenase (cytochrome)